MEVPLAYFMVKLVPNIYQNNLIMIIKVKPLLHLWIQKTIHGLLRRALIQKYGEGT